LVDFGLINIWFTCGEIFFAMEGEIRKSGRFPGRRGERADAGRFERLEPREAKARIWRKSEKAGISGITLGEELGHCGERGCIKRHDA
jgi:hypothetical protein